MIRNLSKLLTRKVFKNPHFSFCKVEQMMLPEVREVIMDIVKESPKCNRSKLTLESHFEDLGFDSLDVVELIVAFEENLGFDIPDEDAENNIKTVKDSIVVFSKHL